MDDNLWPDDWHKLHCPNNHELRYFDRIIDNRVYCVCGDCGIPCAFTPIPMIHNPPPVRIELPTRSDEYIDLPPFTVDGSTE